MTESTEMMNLINSRAVFFSRNDATVKVCSIKIESFLYDKEDLDFAWSSHCQIGSNGAISSRDDSKIVRVWYDSEVERLSPSIEFKDDIELSQYKLQGQFSKIIGTFEDEDVDVLRGGLKRGACLLLARNFLDFCNRIILRIYVEGLQQFSW